MKKIFTVLVFIFFPVFSFSQTSSWFSDGTVKAGLSGVKSFRINIVDINSDDYPDLMLINSQGTISTQAKVSKIYLNVQDPDSQNPHDRIFRNITEGSGIFASNVGDTGRVFSCATMADVNNDGNMDLVTGTWYDKLETFLFPDDRCDVMLGDGQGHFSLVENNGLTELELINASGFTFLDYDLDGNLDIYIPTYFKDRTKSTFMQDYLMRGNGDGTFKNVSDDAGISGVKFPMQGASSTDWNNDGLPDILTSAYCRSGGSVWKNNGNGTFTDVAAEIGYSSYVTGDQQAACQWAAQPADFDNDGDMDIAHVLVHGGLDPGETRTSVYMNSGAANGFKLQRNVNIFPRDNPRSTHLGDQDGGWFDMDNDGRLDFAIAQCVYVPATDRSYILRQNSEGKFDDVTEECGLLYLKETHNIRPVDYDLDGDEDLLVELWRKNGSVVSDISLVENEIGNKNNWVNVKLIAPPGINKNAVGARIFLYAGGVQYIREVQLGQGHFGAQVSVIKTFGIAQNTAIDSIVVRWPSKNLPNTIIYNPPVNQLLKISSNGLISDIEESSENNSFEIFPIPAEEKISFSIPSNFSSGKIKVFSGTGEEILIEKFSSQGMRSISTENFSAGLYLIRISNHEEKIISRSFIKK